MEREGERSATMASAGPSRHLPVQEPSIRRGGSAALLSSVVNRRDASPRGRGSSQSVRAGAVAAAGANRRRSRKVRCAHARLCPGAMWWLWALPVHRGCAEIFFILGRSGHRTYCSSYSCGGVIGCLHVPDDKGCCWGRSHLEVMRGRGPSTIQLSLLIFKLHISFPMIKKYGYCL